MEKEKKKEERQIEAATRHKHGAGSPTSDLNTSPQSRHEGSNRHLGDSQEHESSRIRGHGSRSKSSRALVPSHGVCVCLNMCTCVKMPAQMAVCSVACCIRKREREREIMLCSTF